MCVKVIYMIKIDGHSICNRRKAMEEYETLGEFQHDGGVITS